MLQRSFCPLSPCRLTVNIVLFDDCLCNIACVLHGIGYFALHSPITAAHPAITAAAMTGDECNIAKALCTAMGNIVYRQ